MKIKSIFKWLFDNDYRVFMWIMMLASFWGLVFDDGEPATKDQVYLMLALLAVLALKLQQDKDNAE